MVTIRIKHFICLIVCLLAGRLSSAQTEATVTARTDAAQVTVGDQVRVFIEAQYDASYGSLQWAAIPDTFDKLEVVERGAIDTIRKGDVVTYKQRLLVTGFDSGMHIIPPFSFSVVPKDNTPYSVKTEPLPLLVQTVAVDTTKPFRGIKGIMEVPGSWLDYIWYFLGAVLLIILATYIAWYFRKNKKVAAPATFNKVQETLQEKALRFIDELDREQLWQKEQVKEYYTRLTDIVRQYIEERFRTPAMELTTDELLHASRMNRDIIPHIERLSQILYTADMAKFARAQPAAQEHIAAMDNARRFISETTPTASEITPLQS